MIVYMFIKLVQQLFVSNTAKRYFCLGFSFLRKGRLVYTCRTYASLVVLLALCSFAKHVDHLNTVYRTEDRQTKFVTD